MACMLVVPNLSHQSTTTTTLQLLQSKHKPLFSHHHPLPSLPLLPPPLAGAAACTAVDIKQQHNQRDDFYVNVGVAVRTLRQDLPLLFSRDLNYRIYRDDITFLDPLNTFSGIHNYKLIFWALRFHARLLFRHISLQVLRVWQPSDNLILIRWNLLGVPRVPNPWESQGEFQATSRYKLDRNGKIYEHRVDNLAFNFPPHLNPKPPSSVLDHLVVPSPSPTTTATTAPNPTFLCGGVEDYYSPSPSSWVDLYRAVKHTLDRPGQTTLSVPSPLHYCLAAAATCS